MARGSTASIVLDKRGGQEYPEASEATPPDVYGREAETCREILVIMGVPEGEASRSTFRGSAWWRWRLPLSRGGFGGEAIARVVESAR